MGTKKSRFRSRPVPGTGKRGHRSVSNIHISKSRPTKGGQKGRVKK